MKNWRTWKR